MTNRAFTIVEMLVAIAIVVFLAGITVTVGAGLVERSEVRETEQILKLLDTAMIEWEQAADRKLTWGTPDDPVPGADYDLHPPPTTPFIFVMNELIATIERPSASKAILAKIDPSRIYTYESGVVPPWVRPYEVATLEDRFIGTKTVLDAWGMPIYPTHPGPLAGPGASEVDPDGTLVTGNERYHGHAIARRVCFVSAGPDRAFGSMSSPPSSELYKQTLDNIFSYPIERP